MKNKLFYAILVLLLSISSISYAQDTIPTVKLKSLQHAKSTSIHKPVSTPKYTHCIMVDKEDLCRHPWVQTVDKKNMKVTNTYTFSKDAITHECIIDKPLKHREHYQLPFCLADTIVDDFDSSLSKSKGCYVHIKREKDGTYLGTLVLGIVEFEPGKKMVLQRGRNNYFTWYAPEQIQANTKSIEKDSVFIQLSSTDDTTINKGIIRHQSKDEHSIRPMITYEYVDKEKKTCEALMHASFIKESVSGKYDPDYHNNIVRKVPSTFFKTYNIQVIDLESHLKDASYDEIRSFFTDLRGKKIWIYDKSHQEGVTAHEYLLVQASGPMRW